MECFLHAAEKAVRTCKECGREMCAVCVKLSGEVCPVCRKKQLKKALEEHRTGKYPIVWKMILAGVMIGVFAVAAFVSKNETISLVGLIGAFVAVLAEGYYVYCSFKNKKEWLQLQEEYRIIDTNLKEVLQEIRDSLAKDHKQSYFAPKTSGEMDKEQK